MTGPILRKVGADSSTSRPRDRRDRRPPHSLRDRGHRTTPLLRLHASHPARRARDDRPRRDEFIAANHLLLALADRSSGVADLLPDREGSWRGATPSSPTGSPHGRVHARRPRQVRPGPVEAAADGKLDPVIGRDEEIRRVIECSRRTKNNPVLIGDPGVGKTAIVEGLASASSPATSPTRSRTAASSRSTSAACSPARSTAASSRSGSRPSSRRSRTPTVASSSSSTSCTRSSARAPPGAVDAANLLKPMSRAASCGPSARPRSTSSASTSRRTRSRAPLQPVYVGEPDMADTIAILRGLKERYEAHHSVLSITDPAIVAAATSFRPLHRRPLPPRQGDRPDRRGRLAAQDRARVLPGRDRRDRPHHPARDREAGPSEREGRRSRRGSRRSRPSSPTPRRRSVRSAPATRANAT